MVPSAISALIRIVRLFQPHLVLVDRGRDVIFEEHSVSNSLVPVNTASKVESERGRCALSRATTTIIAGSTTVRKGADGCVEADGASHEKPTVIGAQLLDGIHQRTVVVDRARMTAYEKHCNDWT